MSFTASKVFMALAVVFGNNVEAIKVNAEATARREIPKFVEPQNPKWMPRRMANWRKDRAWNNWLDLDAKASGDWTRELNKQRMDRVVAERNDGKSKVEKQNNIMNQLLGTKLDAIRI